MSRSRAEPARRASRERASATPSPEQSPPPRSGGPADVGRLILYAAALATAGAGLVHLSASKDHPAHVHIAAFFVALALIQIGWAAAVAFRANRRLLVAGAAGNVAVIGFWLATRATAIPFVPGLESPEAVGVKDTIAVLLELISIGSVGLLLAIPAGALRTPLRSPDRAVGWLMAGVLALTLPGVLGPHAHGPDHGAHGVAARVPHTTHDPEEASVVLSAAHGHASQEPVGTVVRSHVEHADTAHVPSAHPSAHPTSSHDAAAAHRPATKEPPWPDGIAATLRYGPFDLPPASLDGRRRFPLISNVVLSRLPTPCADCYVLAGEPNLVHDDGRPANFDTGVMLHHTVLADSSEEDLTCGRDTPLGWLGRRFFASGNERTRIAFPAGFGQYIGNGDWWTGVFEIMNVSESPQRVWFTYTVRYVPAAKGGVEPVAPIWLDIDNCGDSEYAVPAGRSAQTWDWTSSITGRIVSAGGHVHNWGLSTSLSNATTGRQVCKSVAGYGNDPAYMGSIDSMSGCIWDRIGTVRAGEVLRIRAVYDTPKPLDDVMGIMMAFVYETDDLAAGTSPPRSETNPPDGPGPTGTPHDH